MRRQSYPLLCRVSPWQYDVRVAKTRTRKHLAPHLLGTCSCILSAGLAQAVLAILHRMGRCDDDEKEKMLQLQRPMVLLAAKLFGHAAGPT